MNEKNSLESRIRGWLPKNPALPMVPSNVNFEVDQRNLPLRKKTDSLGWAMVFLALLFLFIPIVYSILYFPGGYSIWISATGILGASLFFIFVFYQNRRLNRMRNKINFN